MRQIVINYLFKKRLPYQIFKSSNVNFTTLCFYLSLSMQKALLRGKGADVNRIQ